MRFSDTQYIHVIRNTGTVLACYTEQSLPERNCKFKVLLKLKKDSFVSFVYIKIKIIFMQQVQEVVGVMRNNIDKVLERDSKLNDLDYR